MSEWPMVKLKELMRKTKSIDPRKYPDEEFALYSIPAYDNGIPEKIFGRDIGSSKILLKNSDVVLSKIVPHIRRTWVITDGEKQIGSSEWMVFNDDRFDPQFIANYLKSDVFHYQLLTTVAGVGGSLNRARPAAVAELKIPLPPLGEQKRIAEIFGKVSKAIQQVQGQLERTQELSLSVVDNFVKNELVDTQPLYELVEFRGGSTPSKKNDDFWDDGNIRWFTSKDLKLNELVDSIDHVTESAIKNTALKPVSNIKAIAISLRGMSLAHRVPMSVIPANSCVNQDLKALIPKAEMDVSVIFALLKREEAYLLTKVTTSAHGTKKLDFPHVKNLQIPKLSSVQISKIKLQLEHINQLNHLLHRKLSLLQELQKSLATRAFAGLL